MARKVKKSEEEGELKTEEGKQIFEQVLRIAKQRGFFVPACMLYEPIAGFFDYLHLGTLLKQKLEWFWRKYWIKQEGFYEISGCVVMKEPVFLASGHLKNFNDPLVQCKSCKTLYRADKLIHDLLQIDVSEKDLASINELIRKKQLKCPKCNSLLGEARLFNLMLQVNVGPLNQETCYLRPETCQSIFVDFAQLYYIKPRLPLGIAQIGKAFRNEISPRNALLRLREFTQAEIEIFFDPEQREHEKFNSIKDKTLLLWEDSLKPIKAVDLAKEIGQFITYYLARTQEFFFQLGFTEQEIRLRKLSQNEKPFYATYAWDLELKTPLGWIEVVALHYRSNYDLLSHSKQSKKDLTVHVNGKKFIPHVFEISQGIDRTLFCLMLTQLKQKENWTYFNFKPWIAPYQVAILPLLKRDHAIKAREIFEQLTELNEFIEFNAYLDETGSIGKRYARADEIGVPFCITIDQETLTNQTVTLRERNSGEQKRIKLIKLNQILIELIKEKIKWQELKVD